MDTEQPDSTGAAVPGDGEGALPWADTGAGDGEQPCTAAGNRAHDELPGTGDRAARG